ncbi:MAG: NfeD family protein [Candidatus Hydrogenedentales bacterium]
MLGQLIMSLIGLDSDTTDIAEVGDDLDMGDEYVDTHQGATLFFGILSFRSLVAAVAFFGIGGRAALEAGFTPYWALMCALGAGALAMFAVVWTMRFLYSMHAEGTVHIEHCVGLPAKVYLRIPPPGEGAGKVTVTVQNRTMEYAAVAARDAIPTGATVIVVGISGPHTLEVEPA